MSEPMTDGPNVHRPDAPFHEWTVLTADDADGNRHWFHVPTAALATPDRADPTYLDGSPAIRGYIDPATGTFTPDRADPMRYPANDCGHTGLRLTVCEDCHYVLSFATPDRADPCICPDDEGVFAVGCPVHATPDRGRHRRREGMSELRLSIGDYVTINDVRYRVTEQMYDLAPEDIPEMGVEAGEPMCSLVLTPFSDDRERDSAQSA